MTACFRVDGNGYVDFGQDDWDDEAYSGEDEPVFKRAKGAGGDKKKSGVFNNLAPKKKKATERVSSMFLGAGLPLRLSWNSSETGSQIFRARRDRAHQGRREKNCEWRRW